jgi:DNA invertase Pin-like site-specific DNA recombinase
MRCAVYLRKSVDRDREERSTSIESQRTAILEWAEKNGATILPDWQIEDRGYSGSTEHRPGFQRLLAAAQAGRAPFDCILVSGPSGI